jgi:hypothetical protein
LPFYTVAIIVILYRSQFPEPETAGNTVDSSSASGILPPRHQNGSGTKFSEIFDADGKKRGANT